MPDFDHAPKPEFRFGSMIEIGHDSLQKIPVGYRGELIDSAAVLSGAAPCFAVPADGVKFSPHDF